MPDRVTPADLLSLRHLPVYDIRPASERLGDLGWIPGSLHVPASTVREFKAQHHASGTVVLACVSGRRSRALAEELAAQGVSVIDLEGGLLAWAAELPVCTTPDACSASGEVSFADFLRRAKSCFVVESVESGALEAQSADPLAVIQTVFDELDPGSVRALWSSLDWLAFAGWQAGHRVDAIAKHVTDFYLLATQVRVGGRSG